MDGSIAERIDLEPLKARHVTWRLFLAHPALGLEETDGDLVFAPRAGELGVRWLALDAAEQRARERDLLRDLLWRAARSPGARFEAGWWRREDATADLARRCGASVSDDDGVACGALTDEAIDALVATPPRLIAVEAAELALEIDGDPLCIGVWMDRWKAPVLEQELLGQVHDEAQRRRDAAGVLPDGRRHHAVDRTMRAHVLVAWDRHAFRAFIAAMALTTLLGLHPWGDRSIGAVAVRLAAVVALVIVLGKLIERWYHRSQRESE